MTNNFSGKSIGLHHVFIIISHSDCSDYHTINMHTLQGGGSHQNSCAPVPQTPH